MDQARGLVTLVEEDEAQRWAAKATERGLGKEEEVRRSACEPFRNRVLMVK